ncbi:MAG: hypothetical protein ACI4F7_06875 [Acutalibacteraceae bacterium]
MRIPIYEIDRTVKQTGELFGDGSHILYVNGKYNGNDDIGKLMHDFRCKNASDMNFKQLEEKVKYFKEDERGRGSMCKIMEDLQKAAQIEERNDIAVNLLKIGKLSVSEIAESTGLTVEEVENIKKNLDSKS